MKILSLDIGAGTQDILLYEDGKAIENCVKMILPSPSRVYAARVRQVTQANQDLFVDGDIVGGGSFTVALKAHLENGLRVLMTENAAYTIRNNLEEVKQLGIEVVAGESMWNDFAGERLRIEEVNLSTLAGFLNNFGESFSDVEVVAIAVQDHGASPPGMSNRKFRLHKMREVLERDPHPENLAFRDEEVSPYFLRMRSAVLASKKQLPDAQVLVMDTSPAATLGCLQDPFVANADPVLAVNVGNGHTMATLVSKREIIGVVEHHTRLLNPPKLERLLVDFADGKLSDEDVFNDEGHGLFFLSDPPGFSKIERVAVTGPNRELLRTTNLDVHYALPAGDVMMTGPVGLIKAVTSKYVLPRSHQETSP